MHRRIALHVGQGLAGRLLPGNSGLGQDELVQMTKFACFGRIPIRFEHRLDIHSQLFAGRRHLLDSY
ncbi:MULTISPECIES: hypothetical protein [unclassified Acidovorax]|uniref:hypothetical protein n=1 Tax=unclassified Acidovorax TaxID=2684926 RepID=UPI0037C55BA7